MSETSDSDDVAQIKASPVEKTNYQASTEFDFDADPENPYNWPKWKKNVQLAAAAIVAFAGSVGTSIISPAHQQLIDEFGVPSTVAFLPLTTYVLALGLGPVIGGPLSETVGRKAVFIGAASAGGLFALGAGFTPSFAGLCVLRFFAGFAYGPSLSIASGFLAETYTPADRGLPSLLWILSPFLGPGLGPVLGVFLVDRMGWRWTQFTLVFFSVFSLIWVLIGSESYHPVIQHRRMKELGITPPESAPFVDTLRQFLTAGLLRPLHMMVTEPIVGFLCLYVAFVFGVLFNFFGSFFYIFQHVYGFTMIQSGLVFLAVALGCVIGALNIWLCGKLFYQPQIHRFPPHQVPPEYRLLPAMIGSVALPVSIFIFAWTTRPSVSPAVPILAIVIFSVGNISLFVSALQYIGDVYHRTNVASATSANSLARYGLAAVFPLFSLQLYQNLGVAWASSLFGFISIALFPLPWLLFRFGKTIRSKSKYQTAIY
ncbi:major facilitator superfamily domain-containing protein [Xylaria bambusicola]|uniref:major facilitator superfamily domain-containing protein n=1 Tax=Xylaria bambusicola TaxID=326684 RepID=UPI0020084224|nr:major facilitator superfamily domain-containing protein [Xylaria bambusicola]KAI0521312.1 major facilitator superfamily domain-containing protein [Xylaria bambusicola]